MADVESTVTWFISDLEKSEDVDDIIETIKCLSSFADHARVKSCLDDYYKKTNNRDIIKVLELLRRGKLKTIKNNYRLEARRKGITMISGFFRENRYEMNSEGKIYASELLEEGFEDVGLIIRLCDFVVTYEDVAKLKRGY